MLTHSDILWFINQVDHGRLWDIKRELPWKTTIQTTHPGAYDTQVVFRDAFETPESLGNITFGYLAEPWDGQSLLF